MLPSEARRAVSAATAIVSSFGLVVDDALVLHDSNKLTLRLLPCDVVARVAPKASQNAQFEIDVAQQLAECGSPVARLDPRVEARVHERDGFVVTVWTHYEASERKASPAEYADALSRLHAGMRRLDVQVPSFTERVRQAQELLANPERTPALTGPTRETLSRSLRRGRRVTERGGDEQLVHGEPHLGNVLSTNEGLLFIDFETCCRAPVEFDLAHLPEDVHEHYPDIDPAALFECRMLVLALVTTWRWDRDDELPNGRQRGAEWLGQLQAMVDLADFGRA